eukprot:COSAG02_NODE_1483_length_12385_cov_116.196565_9_plen_55_part_01
MATVGEARRWIRPWLRWVRYCATELLALAEQDEGLEGMDTPLRKDSSFEEEEELA